MLVVVHDRRVDAPRRLLAIVGVRVLSELLVMARTRQRLAVYFGGICADKFTLIGVAVIVVAANHDTAPA